MNEQSNKIERSEVWKKIYKIVNQIPTMKVVGDAADAPSAATEIEAVFEDNTDFRCGQGDNRCNCKTPEECGYIEMAEKFELLNEGILFEVLPEFIKKMEEELETAKQFKHYSKLTDFFGAHIDDVIKSYKMLINVNKKIEECNKSNGL